MFSEDFEPDACCRVLELRQYTLQPGQRDVLSDMFDREFIEPQEDLGIHVVGQFHDAERPDIFVWMRGFRDMPSRAESLSAFYYGPVWKRHRDAANATMIDSDNVLLLRPAWPGSGVPHPLPLRPADPDQSAPGNTYRISIWDVAVTRSDEEAKQLAEGLTETLAGEGWEPVAWYLTEPAENTFPGLPVREGQFVMACVATRSAVQPSHATPASPAGASAPPTQQILALPTRRSQLR